MKTIVLSIGNSDNKLTQQEWSLFVSCVRQAVQDYAVQVHFFGGSENWLRWQNVAWWLDIEEERIPLFKTELSKIGREFKQDSVGWLEGETQFI